MGGAEGAGGGVRGDGPAVARSASPASPAPASERSKGHPIPPVVSDEDPFMDGRRS